MKKTTKTLLSLLLVLVMALQFGAVAPVAHALPGGDEQLGPKEKGWALKLAVVAPLVDGELSVEGEYGTVSDPDSLGLVTLPSTAGDIIENGLDFTPPEDFAVTALYIAPSNSLSTDSNPLPDSTELVKDGSWAEIFIPGKAFNKAAFHLPNDPKNAEAPFVVLVKLSPAKFIPEQESTCKVQGNDAYYQIVGVEDEAYIIGEIPMRDLSTTHKMPLTHHDAETQTCEKAVNGEYWECDECGALFSDENGETEIPSIPQLAQLEHKKPLTHHAAETQTCKEAVNGEYWVCDDCGTLFSDENGETEIPSIPQLAQLEHKKPLIKHNTVPATCKQTGTEEYWECEDCGTLFSDENGETEIEEPVAIPKLTTHKEPLTHHDSKEPVSATEPGNIEYWTCDECGAFFKKVGDEYVQITEAETVVAFVPNTYDIIADGTDTTWKKGSTTGADVEINADFNEVTVSSVKIDNQELTSSQYETKEGSVIVTIGKSVLQELSVGEHTILVTFSDDKTASSVIVIQEADASTPTALELEIAAEGCTKVYDALDFDLATLVPHIKVKNLPEGYTADVEISYEDTTLTSFRDAGTTTVKLHLKNVKNGETDVSDQFTCEDKTGVTLTITKRKITVQTKDDSKVYDGKAWSSSHMSDNQPVVTFTDPQLDNIQRGEVTYNHYLGIKYTASPKSMGTYDNTAVVTVREKVKTASADTTNDTDVTKNYEITYKFGKIKITDANGKVPTSTSPATGDTNNIWLWVGLMAAAVVLVVVILVFTRKGRKNDGATE